MEYIKDLRDQVEKLEAQRKDVDDFIDAAKRNRGEILENVNSWIEKVDGFIVEAKKFLEDGTNVNQKCFIGWFPDLVTRRQLGKEAKDKVEVAKELEKDGYFNSISKPARPLGIESIPSERLVTYETTNLAMMSVMKALTDDKINFIGIHGLGGVGKTTLVKEIGRKAKSDKLFDEVVMAVVLELTTLGIPLGQDHEGCKIIITTRREQVCRTMAKEWETTKIVWLDVLSEQDSWDSFRKNVGDVVNSSALNDVAKEICKECGGLPIAVVTVGKAMEGSKKHFVRAGCNLKDWPNVDSLDKYTGISLMRNQISNLPEVWLEVVREDGGHFNGLRSPEVERRKSRQAWRGRGWQ
ncbi:hypothetical protein HYC85_018376 [Camellia sinensis]|uniref:NB-ARC domain-containing protein n=1 Tax=Camellia sinensis TaxID=4442 RepID=A0A7J7GU55_CAMSI|nr:hypothetical protein HYC85_018376 [Camellia sinensis]